MKKYLSLMLLVVLGCTARTGNHDKINVFLTEWSHAIASGKEEPIRKFYDARFMLPKVLFNAPAGIHYQFDIANSVITSTEKADSVSVPFTITDNNGTYNDKSSVSLTLVQTDKGFIITHMSQELAVKIKEYGLQLEVTNPQSEKMLNYDSILSHVRKMGGTLFSRKNIGYHYFTSHSSFWLYHDDFC